MNRSLQKKNRSIAFGVRHALGRLNLMSFIPLFVILAYWVRIEAVLFVVTFMFPLLLAIQEITGQTNSDDGSLPPGTDEIDFLTGVKNRQYVLRHLGNFLQSQINTGRETAVLHVDVDRFHTLNERYGMHAGDLLLVEVAQRISDCVRERDLVARINGDDFAVVLYPVKKADFSVMLAIADRVREALSQPFSVDQNTCYLTCSIGLCVAGRAPSNTPESLLASAGMALAEAQRQGGDTTRSFSPKMRRDTQKLQTLSSELVSALENGQIRPYFQPQICTGDGQIIGFEALARWDHPVNGTVLPALFLKAIEDGGFAERLSEVILYHALSALKSWDRAGFRVPSVGVNFSSHDLRNPKLVEKIKWEVDRFDIAPSRISIEVLETVVSDHNEDVITRNIRGLAANGFGIDLDDFGTGHASIANIRRFGVNRIKIDRAFITNIDVDSDQQIMTSTILRMAEGLGIEAIAEGVETVSEQAKLVQMGCRYTQGFGLARPMPFEDTIAWLHKHQEKNSGLSKASKKAG